MPRKILRRTDIIEFGGAGVPSLLLRPETDNRVAGVLLLHGYSSTEEILSDTMGLALAMRGIASLSFDLPLHGRRDDEMFDGHPWRAWSEAQSSTEGEANHRPGAPSRWRQGKDLSWEPLRPDFVVQVDELGIQ